MTEIPPNVSCRKSLMTRTGPRNEVRLGRIRDMENIVAYRCHKRQSHKDLHGSLKYDCPARINARVIGSRKRGVQYENLDAGLV